MLLRLLAATFQSSERKPGPKKHHQSHHHHNKSQITNHKYSNMPPKGQAPARVGGGRPAQSNTSYVRNAINELSSPENRSVVVAVSFFAVSSAPSRYRSVTDK
jgi:hypothetical protein